MAKQRKKIKGRGMPDRALYEQVKRVLRQALPMNTYDKGQPFILACHVCGLAFRHDVEVGMAAEHARIEHGINVDAGDFKLDLVWVGEGQPPKGHP